MSEDKANEEAAGCVGALLLVIGLAGVIATAYGLSEVSMWWAYTSPFWGMVVLVLFVEGMGWAMGLGEKPKGKGGDR